MDNIRQALSYYAGRDGNRIAMSDNQRALSRSGLLEWASGIAHELGSAPETIGILGNNSVGWAAAFLGASLAGKTIVPVPTFFSKQQRNHLIHDAEVRRLIVTNVNAIDDFSLPCPLTLLPQRREDSAPERSLNGGEDGGLIIYTSGSTGNPKGVRLCGGQACWSAASLAAASAASADDRYLSMLPLPMLLELICAVMVPILVGGSVYYDGAAAQSVTSGAPFDIAGAFELARPTTSVLVPQLLALYAGQLAAANRRAPASLRFVAVGGAPLSPAIADAAERVKIPFFEGYGLSECASVVAVNGPRVSRRGTVGLPLPGLQIAIEDGEIVVEGPTVMDGYLRGAPAPCRWRTGDMGLLDEDGFLTVLGRKDTLIILPNGRNVNPEWIEGLLQGDSRIGTIVLCQAGAPERLTALIIPSPKGALWFQAASPGDIGQLVAGLCEAAPDYARPKAALTVSREDALAKGLFTATGRIRRTEAARLVHALLGESRTQQQQ
jgi:long-subunit acyl-CoA synthetase (AMP-forming)